MSGRLKSTFRKFQDLVMARLAEQAEASAFGRGKRPATRPARGQPLSPVTAKVKSGS